MGSALLIRGVLGACLFCVAPLQASADDILTLSREFIEANKNRLTMSVTYRVDAAHRNPNPASKDGDLHIAGRSPQIGLATVAEIQNAADADEAVARVHAVEGTDEALQVVGVWRIWPEHGGDTQHVQRPDAGPKWTGPSPTNPPHVFEIHPVLKVDDFDLKSTLVPIDGYTYKEARDAFQRYGASTFEITPVGDKVRMRMKMVGFNYVEFLMKLQKRFHREADGEFVSADIHTLSGSLISRGVRVGFVDGSEPDRKQRQLQEGLCMKVLGIPRWTWRWYPGDWIIKPIRNSPMLLGGLCPMKSSPSEALATDRSHVAMTDV